MEARDSHTRTHTHTHPHPHSHTPTLAHSHVHLGAGAREGGGGPREGIGVLPCGYQVTSPNTDDFISDEAGSPFGWIEPEIAQYLKST